jgi:hypothetical protein
MNWKIQSAVRQAALIAALAVILFAPRLWRQPPRL